MSEIKIYAVYLGGQYPDGRFGEEHQTVFVAATSKSEAKTLSRLKWVGNPDSVHVDSILELDVVDGFKIVLEPTRQDDHVEIVDGYSAY